MSRCFTGSVALVSAAVLMAAVLVTTPAVADVRPHAGMLRNPDVSATHVVFVYANDLWVVPREGGTAVPLAGPSGAEAFPRFSPDGQMIAFMANYDGNTDLYTIPLAGGVPTRVTHHSATEVLCDWTAGDELLFFSNFCAPMGRQSQLFTVSPAGGMPHKLPVPYGANGSISADGVWLAYTPHTTDARTWKRYRGGMATDIWLFNLRDNTSRKITDWEGTDSQPMWHGDKLYYMADAGPAHRLNIWSCDPQTGQHEQITHFSDFDVKWPAMGPGPDGQGEIVLQCGSDLHLLDLATGETRVLDVMIPGDRPDIRPQRIDADDYIQGWSISPTGKRGVLQARGDIWTVPARKGSPRNLTRTSGAHERDPAWSPDGQWIAYFSDETGEYELYIMQSDGKGETRKLTDQGAGFRYSRGWSPDSKHIVYTDNAGNVFLYSLDDEQVKPVDTDPWSRQSLMSWSRDSAWLAYSRTTEGGVSALWLYNVASGERRQVTSGMFDDNWPAFDRKGDYLYFRSNRRFGSPVYADLDGTWVYTDTGVLCVVPLRDEVGSPWAPESDEETWDDKDKDKDEDKDKKKDEENGDDKDADKADEDHNGDKSDDEGADDGDEAAVDDGVSGVWEGTLTGSEPLPPEGLPFTLNLRMSGDSDVSGSMNAGPYNGTVSNGSYDKESGALTFDLEVNTGEGTETFAVTANIDGDSISGTISGEDFTATFEGKRTSSEAPADEEDEEEEDEDKPVEIEIEGFERRAIQLPIGNGDFHSLVVNDKGQLIYNRSGAIKLFDVDDEDKEEKTVLAGTGGFDISADGKKLLVGQGGRWAIVDARAGQKMDKPMDLHGLTVEINPREEWRQMFVETWRIMRDFFYVANMHGVDWPAVREHYGAMLADCVSRDDLSYIISEMISELNVGHAYYMGGSSDRGPRMSVGMLGVDFELADGAYRIAKIYEGGPWDVDARGPLSQPGVDVKEGDYLLAVNRVPVDASKDPWAAFQSLAGQVVTLTVSEKPELDDDAREVVLKLIGGEGGLRYRAWVEKNRAYVDEKTGGRVGYIHVPDTGVGGQTELYRQFYGQRDKEALIFDDRWNGGGQVPDRFIECSTGRCSTTGPRGTDMRAARRATAIRGRSACSSTAWPAPAATRCRATSSAPVSASSLACVPGAASLASPVTRG